MNSTFSSDFFSGNRARLRETFAGTAPIVVAANGLLQRGGDSTFPFEQDASFWYLTGINEPDITLVMDKDKEYLIVPEREATRVAFDGAVEDESLREISGIGTIFDNEAGWRQLGKRLKRSKFVAMAGPAPAYIEVHGLYTNPARLTTWNKLHEQNSDLQLIDVSQQIARLRMVKQPLEIAAIQEAIDITAATIREISRPSKLSKYTYEYEVEADISRGFRSRGASGHAFEPIVASGERACILHNVANNGKLKRRDIMVVDVGAAVNHYAADITRTLSLSTPTKRQQAVYDAVLDVQEYAMGLLKPGAFIRDNEKLIEQYLGEKLRSLGLLKIIDHEQVRHYYPHAASHFLGLNVHDAGDYEMPLAAGMVLTVEPGIYISEEGIGVRIEDDVLITETGNKVLSAGLPRRLA